MPLHSGDRSITSTLRRKAIKKMVRLPKNVLLVSGSRTGGLKPSELAEICRKGQISEDKITFGKIVINLIKGKKGVFLIKDVSL